MGRTLHMAMLAVVAALAGALAGCEAGAGAGDFGQGFSSKAVPATTREQAFAATVEVFRDRFGLDASNAEELTVRGRPRYLASGRDTDTGRLHIISTVSDRRLLPSARIRSEGGVVRADVRMQVQRRDTSQHEAYHAMRSPDDVPRDTPIDRGADLNPDQREVWVNQPRDIPLENDVLSAIQARLGLAPAEQPADEQ